MNHPPIPEDCDFLDHVDGRYYWNASFLSSSPFDLDFCLDSVHAEVRPVLAALMRCAWLDEKPKRMKELDVHYDPDCCLYWDGPASVADMAAFLAEDDRRCGLVRECDANADAWAVWGRA